MPDRVSPLAAFVFQHGDIDCEILFRDVEADGELPGITLAERAAIEAVMPQLEAEWVAILSACRDALLEKAAGHRIAPMLRKHMQRASTLWQNKTVRMFLLPNQRALCGVALSPWGTERHELFTFVWMHPDVVPLAEAAMEGVAVPGLWRNELGSYLVTLDAPKSGEPYTDIAARVADAMWPFVRPIAEALCP